MHLWWPMLLLLNIYYWLGLSKAAKFALKRSPATRGGGGATGHGETKHKGRERGIERGPTTDRKKARGNKEKVGVAPPIARGRGGGHQTGEGNQQGHRGEGEGARSIRTKAKKRKRRGQRQQQALGGAAIAERKQAGRRQGNTGIQEGKNKENHRNGENTRARERDQKAQEHRVAKGETTNKNSKNQALAGARKRAPPQKKTETRTQQPGM